ncbi:unnamed protein product [Merluccius merluccius]
MYAVPRTTRTKAGEASSPAEYQEPEQTPLQEDLSPPKPHTAALKCHRARHPTPGNPSRSHWITSPRTSSKVAVACLLTNCFSSRCKAPSKTCSTNWSRSKTSAFVIPPGALTFTDSIKLNNARENSCSVSPSCCRREKNASCKAT